MGPTPSCFPPSFMNKRFRRAVSMAVGLNGGGATGLDNLRGTNQRYFWLIAGKRNPRVPSLWPGTQNWVFCPCFPTN